jgi:glycerol-3-phosphate cytidylyltransferase
MKIGFTCSTFDLCHAGHVLMLQECKKVCDYLIVGLQVDPSKDRSSKNAPVQTLVERYIQLNAIKYVDEIVPYESERDLEDIFSMFHIDVRVLGVEYKDKDFTGKDICNKRGVQIHFNKRDHRFSSTGLRQIINNREIINGNNV